MQLTKVRTGYFLIYLLVGLVVLKHPGAETTIDAFCLGLAKTMTWLLSAIDSGVARHGAVVIRNTWGYALEISKDCSALSYFVTLAAALLAAPISLSQRAFAVVLALCFIQVINLVRLMSLLYAKVFFPLATFNSVHEQLWPLIMGFCSICFFIIWAKHHQLLQQQSKIEVLDIDSSAEVKLP